MGARIAVVGPGAVGSTVAAGVHHAGYPVVLCGRTARDHLDVRRDGADPIIVPGPVHTDPGGLTGRVDLVVLAVKATQNAEAGRWLAVLCDENTTVCVLQNGVEQVEQVQPHCPRSTVVPGIVWFPAETQPGGWVRLRGEPRVTLPADAGPVAEVLRAAGCVVTTAADFTTEAWRKLLVNALAGLEVLTGRRSGMFRRDDVAALARRYLRECLAVARAEGAALDDAAIDDLVNMLRHAPEDMGTSILVDREARRPLEWDVRNGVIIRKAARHGLPVPISEVLVPLLAAASDGPG
ncbi:MAG: oxidoreductase [Mycolicibacterium sp.]|nr:oxidoreductase [Mycolicibacterium sp.]